MGLFFKNNKSEEKEEVNSYLEDQQSLFNTTGEVEEKKFDDSYDEYVYKPKDYGDVPKYKANEKSKVDIVIDKEDFGYEDINPDIKMVDLQKRGLYEDLSEIVNNAPIDDSLKNKGISIYDEDLKDQIKKDEPIEIIDIDDSEKVVSNVVEEDIDKSKKLSIFGNSDEPIQAKIYDVEDAPKEEKIDIIEPIIATETKDEKAPESNTDTISTDERKYCSQCGAPLSPSATTCFLCGKKL